VRFPLEAQEPCVNNLLTKEVSITEDTTTTSQTSNNETGGREPLAGVKGDVKAGEPYDKGNIGALFLSTPYVTIC
jgi:hypothetical protein